MAYELTRPSYQPGRWAEGRHRDGFTAAAHAWLQRGRRPALIIQSCVIGLRYCFPRVYPVEGGKWASNGGFRPVEVGVSGLWGERWQRDIVFKKWKHNVCFVGDSS